MAESENAKINEIDIISIIKKLKASREFIIKVTTVFVVIGILFAFLNRKEYQSKVDLLSISSSSSEGLGGLLQEFGGLAGVSINNVNQDELVTSELYPDIVKSTPFLLEVLNSYITINGKDSVTVYHYLSQLKPFSFNDFLKDYSIRLPGKIIKLFKKGNSEVLLQGKYIELTLEQETILLELEDRIDLEIDKTTGMISISLIFPDKNAVAELSDKIVKILNNYIVSFKIKKAQVDFEFISHKLDEARENYNNIQNKLAQFQDENNNVTLATFKTKEDRIKNEVNLAFNVYNSIATKSEEAKLKVQENTPVLKVLNPPQIPATKFKPKRALILIGMLFLGLVISIVLLISKGLMQGIKNEYNIKT